MNFEAAFFRNISFAQSDLRGANFAGAHFDKGSFLDADLRGAKLDFACGLQDVDWTGAEIDPELSELLGLLMRLNDIPIDLSGADLANTYITTWYTDRKLTRANFDNADLSNVRFVNVFDARHASFKSANLSGVRFGSIDLSYADFTDATTTDTEIRGADLSYATITDEQLAQMLLDSCTILPNGEFFEPEDCYLNDDSTLAPVE